VRLVTRGVALRLDHDHVADNPFVNLGHGLGQHSLGSQLLTGHKTRFWKRAPRPPPA
jgi:hypothetical protein